MRQKRFVRNPAVDPAERRVYVYRVSYFSQWKPMLDRQHPFSQSLTGAGTDNMRAQDSIGFIDDDFDHTRRVALTNCAVQPRVWKCVFVDRGISTVAAGFIICHSDAGNFRIGKRDPWQCLHRASTRAPVQCIACCDSSFVFGPMRELRTTITIPNREYMRFARAQTIVDQNSFGINPNARC